MREEMDALMGEKMGGKSTGTRTEGPERGTFRSRRSEHFPERLEGRRGLM